MALRADVNKALELARNEKIIGKPLDAEVTLYMDDEGVRSYDAFDLKTIFIVSGVTLLTGKGEGYTGEQTGTVIAVAASAQPKCSRCWTHDRSVGENTMHPELCSRCAEVIST